MTREVRRPSFALRDDFSTRVAWLEMQEALWLNDIEDTAEKRAGRRQRRSARAAAKARKRLRRSVLRPAGAPALSPV